MKKKSLIAALTVLMISTAAAKDTLAVLPFTGGTREESETAAELFSYAPELKEAFVLIPRTRINQAIYHELDFQMGALTDPDTVAAIGKQLGAKYIVAGNITRLGRRKLLIISIINTNTLQQIAGDIQTYNRSEEIESKAPDMARNIVMAIQNEPERLPGLSVVPVTMGGNVDSGVAHTLAQILSIYIIRSGKYSVYPRTGTLEQVKEEYKTQLSGITADENVVDIGKGDNPHLVLSVAARRLGTRNMFNAAIINIESGAQETGRSVNYNTLNDGIDAMAELASALTGVKIASGVPVFKDRTIHPVGYGALNLAAGLGSFIQGDWGGGLTLLAGYGAAAGLIVWELSLNYEDELAGIPGAVGLGAAGLTALYGFIRPFVYQRSRTLAGIADGINLAVVPEDRNRTAVRLSYTIRF